MLFGQGLGLAFGKAALRQALDESVGIEGDGFGHGWIIGIVPAGGKGRRCRNPVRGRVGNSPAYPTARMRAKPASRSAIRSSGFSRPIWKRRQGPAARHSVTVR